MTATSLARVALALAALAAMVPTGTARAAGFPDPLASPKSFASPPMEARPKFRWWWGSLPFDPNEVASEVDAFAQAGFGAAEAAFGDALGGGNGWGKRAARAVPVAALAASTASANAARAREVAVIRTAG